MNAMKSDTFSPYILDSFVSCFFFSSVPYWILLVIRFLYDCHIDYVDFVWKPTVYVLLLPPAPSRFSLNSMGTFDLDSSQLFFFIRKKGIFFILFCIRKKATINREFMIA